MTCFDVVHILRMVANYSRFPRMLTTIVRPKFSVDLSHEITICDFTRNFINFNSVEFFLKTLSHKLYRGTVQPPPTVTSPQRRPPLHNGHFFFVPVDTICTLTLVETYLEQQRPLKCVCQNNFSTTASFFSD